ncbi:MAG: DUF58 domain-containing protein [Nitriliruptoraceae bacterium]|nr:DUF58 domain-containing protein [Nitriliruptoraceae bacterium]
MFTRLGWSLLATSVVLIVAGVVLFWPPLLAMGTVGAVVVGVAALYLIRPADLRIERRIAPDRVAKGELAIAHLNVRNRSRRLFPGELGRQPIGDTSIEVELPRLRRAESDLRTAVLPTDQRGRHEVGPVVLERTDPFRLVQAERRYAGTDELLVLPKILPFRAVRSTLTRSVDGSTDDTNPNGTMVFHQMREYVPGDDVRRIHWPSTAKVAHTGQLIVRQDIDEAQPYVVVLVDLRPQGYSQATFELAVDAAASVVHAASLGRAPFAVRTTGGVALGGPSNHATAPAMEALALAEPTPEADLGTDLRAIRRLPGGAALVVVTGVPADGDIPAMTGMRGKFQRVMLLSVLPEPRPPQVYSGLTLVQGADEEQLSSAWNVAIRR